MRKKLLAIIMCVAMALCVTACGTTASTDTDTDDQATTEENVTEDTASDNDIAEVEVQGKELAGGTYIIGEDFPAGKYNFTYKTEMSEDDYWGNDYFYITRSGSEGSDETLGGTKFDERFGGFEYGAASKGKTSYVNLKDGDKIEVNADEGTWTY